MDPIVAALALASACLNPLWYALAKRDRDTDAAYLAMVTGVTALALVHGLASGADMLAPLARWDLMAISLAGQVVYGTAVVLVLQRGDLSAYYPIIRSSPFGLVLVGWAVFGERYSAATLAGIALVLAGAYALQWRPGVRLLAAPGTLALAALAMFATVAYSLADALLVREASVAAVMFWVTGLSLPILAWRSRLTHPEWRGPLPFRVWTRQPLAYLAMGPIGYASYTLVLAAYSLGGNIAAINALRQASIPVSVLIGGLWLAEGALPRRLAAALVLAAGVAVIVTAR